MLVSVPEMEPLNGEVGGTATRMAERVLAKAAWREAEVEEVVKVKVGERARAVGSRDKL